MSTRIIEALASRPSLRSRVEPSPEGVGSYIGPINLVYHCWTVTGCFRDLFYSELKDNILRYLDGWSASLSNEDFVILSLYMIGTSKRKASPTICFISESSKYRKEARNVIKASALLKRHPEYKTAHMANDPAWGGELVQLASGGDSHIIPNHVPFKKVFILRSTSMIPTGMQVFVQHDQEVRTAAANSITLQGQIFYLTPSHVFFEKTSHRSQPEPESGDNFEIDSDDEIDGDERFEVMMTSAGSRSSKHESTDTLSSDDGGQSTSSLLLPQSSPSTLQSAPVQILHKSVLGTGKEQGDDTSETHNAQTMSSPQKYNSLDASSYIQVGHLIKWSIDQDWAIIGLNAVGARMAASVHGSKFDTIFNARVATMVHDETEIYAHIPIRGRIKGKLARTPSYITIPRSRTFQEVYSVKIDSCLSEGDCGSAIFGKKDNKFYGHIIAGCRGSGFAYVIAAKNMWPAIEQAIGIPEKTSQRTGSDLGQSRKHFDAELLSTHEPMKEEQDRPADTVASTRPVGKESTTSVATSREQISVPGFFAAADITKFAELSGRIFKAMRGLPLGPLTHEFGSFHGCLSELSELMVEFGRPLPLTLGDFEETLRAYEDLSLNHNPGKFSPPRPNIYQHWSKKTEALRERLKGHGQVVNLLISFLQLRLSLESTAKREQRLLLHHDRFGPVQVDVGETSGTLVDHAYEDSQSSPSPNVSVVLHREWEMFSQWLKITNDLNTSGTSELHDLPHATAAGRNPSMRPMDQLGRLRREVADAITLEEHRAKRLAANTQMNLGPLSRSVSEPSKANMPSDAFQWKSISRLVQVQRGSSEHWKLHRTLKGDYQLESEECDLQWCHREDMGMTIRAVYSPSKDGEARIWTTQHFPSTGPSIPLTDSYTGSKFAIGFPKGTFGELDKGLTEIRYIFKDANSADAFQTLLYTNDGRNPAVLLFDRPILTISSDRNKSECRSTNLRLWRRNPDRVGGKESFVQLLFFTNATGWRGKWVEEPYHAFRRLPSSLTYRNSDWLKLQFVENGVWRRPKSLGPSIRPSSLVRYDIDMVGESLKAPDAEQPKTAELDQESGRGKVLNRFNYSELNIRFLNKKDCRDFLELWKG